MFRCGGPRGVIATTYRKSYSTASVSPPPHAAPTLQLRPESQVDPLQSLTSLASLGYVSAVTRRKKEWSRLYFQGVHLTSFEKRFLEEISSQPDEWAAHLSKWNALKQSGVAFSLLTYTQFLELIVRHKQYDRLPQFVSEMLQQGVRPDNRFAAKLISAFGHTQQYDKALSFFRDLETKFGVKPDRFVYYALFTALGYERSLTKLKTVWVQLQNSGVEVDAQLFRRTIASLANAGMPFPELIEAFYFFLEQVPQPDEDTITALVNATGHQLMNMAEAYSREEAEACAKLYADLKRRGVKLTARNYGNGAAILEEILHDMKNAGFLPGPSQYTSLIIGLVEAREFAKAEAYFEEMHARGFQPPLSVYTVMWPVLAYRGKLDRIDKSLEEIKTLRYTMDEQAFVSLLNAYYILRDMERTHAVYLQLKEEYPEHLSNIPIMRSLLRNAVVMKDSERKTIYREEAQRRGLLVEANHIIESAPDPEVSEVST